MLNLKQIQAVIEATKVTKEVKLECFDTVAHVKKFNRKDADVFSNENVNTVDAMIYVGIVDEEGERIFESIESISELPSAYTIELFTHVNKYNSDTVEKQAKK